MATIDFEERGPQLGLAGIEDFERSLGRKLPGDYRSFLLDTNGGRPEPNSLTMEKTEVSCGVNQFYSVLDRRGQNDLLTEQAALKSRIPEDMLVIADCEGGNRVCISLRGEDFGSVFFWDHELGLEDDPSSAFFPIAPDFSAFFNALSKLDPSKIVLQPEQIIETWIDPDFLREIKRSK